MSNVFANLFTPSSRRPAGALAGIPGSGWRLFELRRFRRTAARLSVLAPAPRAALRLLFVLALGFLELRVPRLRGARVRSFDVGRRASRRRLHVRANGMDTFTFYEVFIKGVYDGLLPLDLDDVVLDLGANIGMTSAYFDFCCPWVTIVAAEPEPGNGAFWRRNVRSPSATLVAAAVSESVGEATLVVADPTSHHLASGSGAANEGIRVATVTPESLATSMPRAVTVVKCDIEGAEEQAFGHGWPFLDAVRAFAVEVHGSTDLGLIESVMAEHGLVRRSAEAADLPELFVRP